MSGRMTLGSAESRSPSRSGTAGAVSWQAHRPGPRVCALHSGNCAYQPGDPARCDRCHRSWAAIDRDSDQTRASHAARHDAADKAERANARRRGTKKAAA